MSQDLHNAYRPDSFDGMYGQQHIVKSLQNMKADVADNVAEWAHSYLFVGGAGCGKTTTARIIAKEVGALQSNITELDAATYTSVDAMRQLLASVPYKGFGSNPAKVYIIDEVHRLSKNAFDALLKTLEEPPEHVYFVLCTTESGKVPKTIASRCIEFNFKSLSKDDLCDLIEDTAESEDVELPDGAAMLVAKSADGSPRMALTNLAKVLGCDTKKEVAQLLEQVEDESQIIDLAKMISSGRGFDWSAAVKILKGLTNENPESIRIVIVNYVQKVLLGTTNADKAAPLLAVLSAFSEPFRDSEKMAPLLLAVGELLFDEDDGE